jgi:hypothetical protein
VLQSFPQDLVLVGRSTVLIKGIAARVNVSWSLAEEWAPIARRALVPRPVAAAGRRAVRFRTVLALFGQWCRGKLARGLGRLPPLQPEPRP